MEWERIGNVLVVVGTKVDQNKFNADLILILKTLLANYEVLKKANNLPTLDLDLTLLEMNVSVNKTVYCAEQELLSPNNKNESAMNDEAITPGCEIITIEVLTLETKSYVTETERSHFTEPGFAG